MFSPTTLPGLQIILLPCKNTHFAIRHCCCYHQYITSLLKYKCIPVKTDRFARRCWCYHQQHCDAYKYLRYPAQILTAIRHCCCYHQHITRLLKYKCIPVKTDRFARRCWCYHQQPYSLFRTLHTIVKATQYFYPLLLFSPTTSPGLPNI